MTRRTTPRAEIIAHIPGARAREAREHKAGRRATSARYDRASGRIVLELSSGYLFGFPVSTNPYLAQATTKQLSAVELSPSGDGLHWEELDVDLSVPGLLLSALGRAEQLTELARIAGRSTSTAKADASRANGALGGRPRKAARR